MDRQIDYLKSIDPGFNRENVLIYDIQDTTMMKRMDLVKKGLQENPNILSAGVASHMPSDHYTTVYRIEKNNELEQQEIDNIVVDEDFLETMDIEVATGRSFEAASRADYGNALIINETAVKAFDWGDEPLDKRIRHFHGNRDLQIVGVIKDFVFTTYHRQMRPLLISLSNRNDGFLYVRINDSDIQGSLAHIEDVVTKFDPYHPFEYRFLDAEFDKQFKSDLIQQKMISTLSYISIFISVLGLIGLSAFTVSQKAKEISIRKTLGASVSSILILFSKGYVKLILLSILVAIPLSRFLIQDWMAGFAYQMNIEWYYLVLPGLGVLLFGLLTVLIQSLRSATANPVDGLRSE